MIPATQRFLEADDLLDVLVDHISDFKTLLRLALVNRRFHTICAVGLNRHIRIAATGIIDPETLDCLTESPYLLHHVQSLDIDVGRRPGWGEPAVFGLMGLPQSLMPVEYGRKLSQLAAGVSKLLSRMPGLLTFTWFGDDVPLDVVKALQSECLRLQNISWLLRRRQFGSAPFPYMFHDAEMASAQMGAPLARLQDMAAFANLTSFNLQRTGFGLEHWAAALLVLGQKSPRLAHLSLSQNPQEYYAIEPLSVEALSNKYHEASGRPFSLKSLHLRVGFQFLPLSAQGGAAAKDQQHPAPYLERLLDTSLVEAISIHVQKSEPIREFGPPEDFYPVAWNMLNPAVLPRLQSLWVSSVGVEAYRYLHNGIDANWLASLDLTIGRVYWSARPTQPDYMVELFFDGQNVGPGFRRARSIILPHIRKRDMAMVQGYGAVRHLSAMLHQYYGPREKDLRSFYKLRGLESIHLLCDGMREREPAREVPRFVEKLAAACPELRYVRIDTVDRRGYRFRAWAVRHQEGVAVPQELGTLEEPEVRPSVYDAVIKELECHFGYTLGCHINKLLRVSDDEAAASR